MRNARHLTKLVKENDSVCLMLVLEKQHIKTLFDWRIGPYIYLLCQGAKAQIYMEQADSPPFFFFPMRHIPIFHALESILLFQRSHVPRSFLTFL